VLKETKGATPKERKMNITKKVSLRKAYAAEYGFEMAARGVTSLTERTKREIRKRVDAAARIIHRSLG
jgi:hypothetical protein